ncbi:MAG: VWA domain-containing protein [Actinobacteria bacterium]|nr:VWA domain-containing protein [Actinomycetota bacterium]
MLAAALVAACVLAFLVAPRTPGRRFLPADSTGIVILDVSSSVRPSTYYRIEQTLSTIAASQSRLGLVVFSDVAYEAFPPGTAASELRLLLRFFAPSNVTATGPRAELPRSPWDQWFSAGTRVSSGLFLAAHLLDEQHAKKGAVMLISDLADDPSDLTALTNAVALFQLRKIPLQIVALQPSLSNALFFRRLLGTDALFQLASLPTGAQARGKLEVTGTFPTPLAIFAVIALLLLAVNEWRSEPLRWREVTA